MIRSKHLDLLLFLWYIIFFISVVFFFRAISSIFIGLILATGLIKNKIDTGSWLSNDLLNPFLATCLLFYLIQVIPVISGPNLRDGIPIIQMKSALFLIPIALSCCKYINESNRNKLMKYYVWILAAALFYCLLIASYHYFFLQSKNDVFFYHELVSPIRQHAVQVSILLFSGLIFLLEKLKKGMYFHNKQTHITLLFYFAVCILLLSSKLVIAFTVIVFLYYCFLFLKHKFQARYIIFIYLITGITMIILVLSTQNKVSKRFNEILSGDLNLVQKQNYNPAIYFNGLQFRLIQWRFVSEILNEQHAWLTGVSANAQPLLNKKYINSGMYIGDSTTPDRGFIGYNTHAQFLESLLQSGIAGLIVFISICIALIFFVTRRKNRELTFFVILLVAYCFNESVYESQYGIILFTFFPLFHYYGTAVKIKDLPV